MIVRINGNIEKSENPELVNFWIASGAEILDEPKKPGRKPRKSKGVKNNASKL